MQESIFIESPIAELLQAEEIISEDCLASKYEIHSDFQSLPKSKGVGLPAGLAKRCWSNEQYIYRIQQEKKTEIKLPENFRLLKLGEKYGRDDMYIRLYEITGQQDKTVFTNTDWWHRIHGESGVISDEMVNSVFIIRQIPFGTSIPPITVETK